MPGAAWARTVFDRCTPHLLLTQAADITAQQFVKNSPAGSFHRKRSPFLPEEGWFGVAQDKIFLRWLSAWPRHLR